MTDSTRPADSPERLDRRRALQLLSGAAGALVLAACSGNDGGAAPDATGSTPLSTGSTGAASPTTAASSASTPASGSWASGGTDLITVGFPDDSIFSTADACQVSLTQATTEGPCYFQSDTGQDISLGRTGLPMQLSLQLVDQSCAPLEGYVVEVWHCDSRGIYSGDTSESDDAARFAGDFCTAGDEQGEASTWFRGQLTTDAAGRADFLSIFPGWYSGRTIHIHVAVSDPDGTTRVISQFGFTDDFVDEICTTHPEYADRGTQDTPLASDNVFPDDAEPFLLTTRRNIDSTLLAHSVIQIDPTSVASESAGDQGGGGPGGA